MPEEKRTRCMVCGKERALVHAICEECKATIRGESLDRRKQIKKDADREFRREGVPPKE